VPCSRTEQLWWMRCMPIRRRASSSRKLKLGFKFLVFY
jgi:hypothetical protein